MLTNNQTQSMHRESPKIISRILVVIFCVLAAILISLVDIKTTINSLTIELASGQERSFRLYYDTGRGYNEQESIEGEVLRRDKQLTTYHFPIPYDKTLIAIRIDPDEQPARYLIKRISVNYLDDSKRVYPHLTWNAGQMERLFIPLHNVKPFVLQQSHLLVETDGPDPYFGTKDNLSETWERLRNEQNPLLLPLKIGGYFLLVPMVILIFFHRSVSTRMKEVSHLWSKAVILGFIILFALSAYLILAGGGLSIGAYYLFFYWIYLAGVFFFAGWITQRLLNFVCRDVFSHIDLSQCVILGAVSLTIAAMLLHLILPLNGTLHMVAILSFCIFCAFDYKRILNYIIEKLNRAGVVHQCFSTTYIFLTVIIFTGFILLVLRAVYLSIGGPAESDTLLYHAQIVKWIKEYPIVPGLGNLHGRLAYNSSFHVLASFLDIGAFQDKSFHGLNGFFFLFLQANLLIRVWCLCHGAVRISNIFAALFIFLEPFLITDSFFAKMNSLSTDFMTLVLTGYIILYFIQLLEDRNLPAKGEIIIGLVLTAFAATVKLVSVPLLLLTIVILIRYIRAGQLRIVIKGNKRFYLILYFLIFILFAPWSMRSVILSGYPVYPVYQIDPFNPDWKVPKARVVDETRWIQSWARVPKVHPDQVLNQGFSHWFNRWNKQAVIPLGVIFGVHLVILSLFFSRYKNILLATWPIYIALSAALLYWFFSAPDLRFGYGIIYASSIFLVSIIIFRPLQAISENQSRFHLLTVVISICMLLTIFGKSPNHISYLNEKLIDMPVLPTKEYVAKAGLKLRIPIQGDMAGNAELPSTPYPSHNIVLRKDGLGGGFRTSPE
jgi:hypothetical protein